MEITLLFIAIIFRRNIEYNSANVMWQEDLRDAFLLKLLSLILKQKERKEKENHGLSVRVPSMI